MSTLEKDYGSLLKALKHHGTSTAILNKFSKLQIDAKDAGVKKLAGNLHSRLQQLWRGAPVKGPYSAEAVLRMWSATSAQLPDKNFAAAAIADLKHLQAKLKAGQRAAKLSDAFTVILGTLKEKEKDLSEELQRADAARAATIQTELAQLQVHMSALTAAVGAAAAP